MSTATLPAPAPASRDVRGGWSAENTINLTEDGSRIVRVSTHKVSSGALVTSATAMHALKGSDVPGLGKMYGWLMGSEPMDYLVQSSKRVTGRVVTEQHAEVMAGSPALFAFIEKAKAYYAAHPDMGD